MTVEAPALALNCWRCNRRLPIKAPPVAGVVVVQCVRCKADNVVHAEEMTT